jgi:hypothetical protein
MRHETQIETLKTLLELREQGRDQEMLGKVVQIPVRNYTDPEVLKREMMTCSTTTRWSRGTLHTFGTQVHIF